MIVDGQRWMVAGPNFDCVLRIHLLLFIDNGGGDGGGELVVHWCFCCSLATLHYHKLCPPSNAVHRRGARRLDVWPADDLLCQPFRAGRAESRARNPATAHNHCHSVAPLRVQPFPCSPPGPSTALAMTVGSACPRPGTTTTTQPSSPSASRSLSSMSPPSSPHSSLRWPCYGPTCSTHRMPRPFTVVLLLRHCLSPPFTAFHRPSPPPSHPLHCLTPALSLSKHVLLPLAGGFPGWRTPL